MQPDTRLTRRSTLLSLATCAGAITIGACSEGADPARYNQADIDQLARQRLLERQASGRGPFGRHVYRGYRGLAELPWFELDERGNLRCTDHSLPPAIDVHAHLGMSVLFRPELDLLARTGRVRHLLDCDATQPGCELDLDIYINGNFSEAALRELQRSTLAQGLWGSRFAQTHTVPNLLEEMDAMRVEQALILPIKLGLPFGDNLTEQWRSAIDAAQAGHSLICGFSVQPGGEQSIEQMRRYAASGARVMKLHPTVQSFYPDDPAIMPLYEEAQRLGVVIFFHGGRAGIEPESRHRYALPRHYEAVLADFPQLQVILGHAGARDNQAMLALAHRYDNAWLGIHGQSVTHLNEMISLTNGERLLFGTDWPFYHIGSSLAKVLISTQQPGRQGIRRAILRDNALALLPELAAG